MTTARQHWLLKSEPSTYSFEQLVSDGHTRWDGVRNFAARNHLRAMKKGDLCLYYHSGDDKAAVGVARVTREAFPDPTAKGDDWSAVDVEAVRPLHRPVTLAEMKANPLLSKMAMVRRPRLSVSPVTEEEFAAILELAKTLP